MAEFAVARDAVCALRREIARIEGRLTETLAAPPAGGSVEGAGQTVLRRNGRVLGGGDFLRTGVEAFDAALGGGVPKAALVEIHGRETRDAAAVAGFALALVGLLSKAAPAAPALWIGTAEVFGEAGCPYVRGLDQRFGIAPQGLLLSETAKLADALWIAEEAASLKALSAVILELRGNPHLLDLTATRRLHRRAHEAARPFLLLRQSAHAEPTAAPARLVVAPAPAAQRTTLNGALAGSIGAPRFAVTVDKNRLAPPADFILEWNADESSFQQRWPELRSRPENHVAMVSLPQHGAGLAPEAGESLARQRRGHASPRRQSSG